jgi:small-conductance mechanosensitive channel
MATINAHPLDFGLRAGGIFAVIVVALVLGRWLQRVVSRYPVHVEAAAGRRGLIRRVIQRRSSASRWLGQLAFFSVALAGALAIVVIVEYGNPNWPSFDLKGFTQVAGALAQRVAATLLIAPVAVAVGRLTQRATVAALSRLRVDEGLTLLGGRVIYGIVLIAGALVVLVVWNVPLILPVTFLSALTLALGLALQDVMKNIFAGVYLLLERPFVIGDEITVTGFSGRVEDIQLRITSLLAPDGQRVLVPNGILLSSAVVNATAYQRRRATLTITLPAAEPDDFAQVEERILAALKAVEGIRADPPPQVVLNRVTQGKEELRAVFWVPGRDENAAQAAVSEAVDQVRVALAGADVAVGGLAAATASA